LQKVLAVPAQPAGPVAVPPTQPVSPVTVPPTPQPVPTPWSQPVTTVTTEPTGSPWPWLGGALLVIAAGGWTFRFRAYRLKRREAYALRDSFLGDLLDLMQRQVPLARDYTGEETHALYTEATATADQALAAEQQGEELRQQAERMARFWRFAKACDLLDAAGGCYQEAQGAFTEARQAWETVATALHEWDDLAAGVDQRLTATAGAITFEQSRTGWPLTALSTRRQQADVVLVLARSRRDADPVQAARLARSAGTELEAIGADLASLSEVARALEEQRRRHADAAAEVEEARRTLSLRFVEASPDAELDRSTQAEAGVAAALPEGDVAAARQGLSTAVAAAAEAMAIVERYRRAIREYPQKSAALATALAGLPSDERQAAATLADLTARYAPEDWDDVHTLAADLANLQVDVRTGLDETARLTNPAVQRHLQAAAMLHDLAARREQLRQALPVLLARPSELDTLAGEARRDLEAMQLRLRQADEEIARDVLTLPPDLAERLEDARRQCLSAEELGRTMPLPAHRFARTAADGAAVALGAREAVAEVARLAAAARLELARVQAQAVSALEYASYSSYHAATVQGALSSAELALSTGEYQLVLTEAARAADSCHGLMSAYEDSQRSSNSNSSSFGSSSGGGGSIDFGSSSGGGGSFDSGSSSSSSSDSTGGGGSW
jgi:hypothetical protein